MHKTTLTKNEEIMYLRIKQYLRYVLNEEVPDFQHKHFLALLDVLFEKYKVEAIKYLRGLFPMGEIQWIPSGYDNNKFEQFINTECSYVKPQQTGYSKLGLKEAKDIIDWIEANRKYTHMSS
jgi:hypothetical protein